MKPLYFPFTYIGQPLGKALAACFGQFAVYRPSDKPLPAHMLEWVQRGILEIRVPVKPDPQVIERVISDYRAWAELHQGGPGMKTLVLNYLKDAIPFYSETSPSRIISEIRATGRNPERAVALDPLLQAVVFLEFAQEFDREIEEISQDLQVTDITRRELISNLRGGQEAGELASGEGGSQDSMEYMTSERLKAWAQLSGRDREVPGLLITSSRSLLDQMLDQLPPAEAVFQHDSIPLGGVDQEAVRPWQDELARRLTDVLDLDAGAAADDSSKISIDGGPGSRVSLRIYRIPGQAPQEVLAACSRSGVLPAVGLQQSGPCRNTLLGHIAVHL